MTPNQLIAEARTRIVDQGGDAEDPRIGADFMLSELNRGARTYERRAGAAQRTAAVVIAADGTAALPADYVAPKALYHEGDEVAPSSRTTIMKARKQTAAAPIYWCVYARSIHVGPLLTAAVAAVFDYFGRTAEAVDADAPTGWPAETEDAALEHLVYKSWLALENETRAAAAKTLFDELVGEADNDHETLSLSDLFDEESQDWRPS